MEVRFCKLSKRQKATAMGVLKASHKLKVLGSGATSTVYPFGRNRVIRVQEAQSDYDAETGLVWAEYCIKSRSKHVPKIDFIGVVHGRSGLSHVVTVLERLEEIEYHDELSGKADLSYHIENFLMDYRSDEDDLRYAFSQLGKHFPRRAADSMRRTLLTKDIRFNDLHSGNWMMRKKDQRFVITDPIC